MLFDQLLVFLLLENQLIVEELVFGQLSLVFRFDQSSL